MIDEDSKIREDYLVSYGGPIPVYGHGDGLGSYGCHISLML
jgi:hypothetical protein